MLLVQLPPNTLHNVASKNTRILAVQYIQKHFCVNINTAANKHCIKYLKVLSVNTIIRINYPSV
jgi:hypothetical protein